jgi:undecaprenyl-diphosphatase
MRLPTQAWRPAAATWVAVLLVVLGLLSLAVNARLFAVSDSLFLTIAQTPAAPPLDLAMVGISLLGSAEVTTVVIAGLVAATLLQRRRLSIDVLVPVAVLFAAIAIELAGKHGVHQPLPPGALVRGPRVGVTLATPYSFPSGHMTRATFVYGLLALRLARRFRSVWWLWLGVVVVWTIGFSRVYLAHHWPTDVAGGILLGGAALALSLALAPEASLGESAVPPPARPSRSRA